MTGRRSERLASYYASAEREGKHSYMHSGAVDILKTSGTLLK